MEGALGAFTELDQGTEFESLALAGKILALRKLGRPEEAELALEKSLGKPAQNPDDCLNLARSFTEFNEFPDAVLNFREAIRLNPGLADAHNEFAWAQGVELQADGELFAKCVAHAELAVALSPKESVKGNYLDTLGWLWYRKGNLKKAKRYLQQAVKWFEPDLIIRHHLRVVEGRLAAEN